MCEWYESLGGSGRRRRSSSTTTTRSSSTTTTCRSSRSSSSRARRTRIAASSTAGARRRARAYIPCHCCLSCARSAAAVELGSTLSAAGSMRALGCTQITCERARDARSTGCVSYDFSCTDAVKPSLRSFFFLEGKRPGGASCFSYHVPHADCLLARCDFFLFGIAAVAETTDRVPVVGSERRGGLRGSARRIPSGRPRSAAVSARLRRGQAIGG